MSNSKICILLIVGLTRLAIYPQTSMTKEPLSDNIPKADVSSCEEALKNVRQVKVGMTEDEILALLGKPTATKDDNWSYNFLPCSPPPKVGEQIIIGVGFIFKEKIVQEIGWAIVCATGVAQPDPKGKKKKNKI